MTGTGTAADPYVVDNWADFVTAVGSSGAYVELDSDIDMNTELPDGVQSAVQVACTQVNGNGHSIRNLYCNKAINVFDSSNSIPFENINFLDLYYNPGGAYGIFDYIILRHCKVSGLIYGGYLFARGASNTSYRHAYGCSFNLDGDDYSPLIGGGNYPQIRMENCNIELHGNSNRIVAYLYNCPVTGSIKVASSTYAVFNGDYSIINADLDIGRWEGNGFSATNVYNSDKMLPGTPQPSAGIAVTTEQLKDPAYLRRLGFPIGVD